MIVRPNSTTPENPWENQGFSPFLRKNQTWFFDTQLEYSASPHDWNREAKSFSVSGHFLFTGFSCSIVCFQRNRFLFRYDQKELEKRMISSVRESRKDHGDLVPLSCGCYSCGREGNGKLMYLTYEWLMKALMLQISSRSVSFARNSLIDMRSFRVLIMTQFWRGSARRWKTIWRIINAFCATERRSVFFVFAGVTIKWKLTICLFSHAFEGGDRDRNHSEILFGDNASCFPLCFFQNVSAVALYKRLGFGIVQSIKDSRYIMQRD